MNTVVGVELTDSQDDTHLILEYEANDVCGTLTAPRANRSVDLVTLHDLELS